VNGRNPKNPSYDDIGISAGPEYSSSGDYIIEESVPVQPTQKAKDPLIGRLVGGQWRMERRFAEGGMGVIYEAAHHQRMQRVAVKILQTVLRMDSLHIDRFYHEARILQRLRHPNIVSVYEFGFEDDLGFYLVMELLHGCGLDVYLQLYQGQMPLDVLCHIFVQICEGMHYAHEEGVLHRDLKPENIFILQPVQGFERLKILDFGVGKIVQDKVNAITQHGKTVGTPRYISPEQAVGTPLDRRTDIYSLAVILFEILTGGPLFKADNPAEYMSQHVFTDPPFLSEVAGIGTYPQGIEELLADCLSKHPEHRPETMLVFRDRLVQSLVDEGIALPETVKQTIEVKKEEPVEEGIGSYRLNFAQTERRERVSLREPSGGEHPLVQRDAAQIQNLEAEKRALRARRFQRDDHIPDPEPKRSWAEVWADLGSRRWWYVVGFGMIVLAGLFGAAVFLAPVEEEPLVSDTDWAAATHIWSRATDMDWMPHLKKPKPANKPLSPVAPTNPQVGQMADGGALLDGAVVPTSEGPPPDGLVEHPDGGDLSDGNGRSEAPSPEELPTKAKEGAQHLPTAPFERRRENKDKTPQRSTAPNPTPQE